MNATVNAGSSSEARFIREVDTFEFAGRDLAATLQSLDAWRANLTADLLAHRIKPTGLHADSSLANRVESIDATLRESTAAWTQQRANLQPVQSLADSFDDKALLLVFGKFNAGKSAFCNFLADRFAAFGKPVQYFHVNAGKIVATHERFREGSTETTSRLQGVLLGEKLVLLDTPGLHSATHENAALTQRFMDSADAVLWLTSSTSPGQVQELDELGHELRRGKVLMPVVTRSDAYDEDEVDGAICKVLRNKPASIRALQESDIAVRAKEKLLSMGVDAALLESPVSISAYMAREAGQSAEAMEETGFERLYNALLAITASTLSYKRRKHAEVLLHHLEEDVLGSLHATLLPAFAALNQAAQNASEAVDASETRMVNAAWRGIVPMLPDWLDAYVDTRDIDELSARVSGLIDETMAHEVGVQLAGYAIAQAAPTPLDLDEIARIQGESVDYQKLYGTLQSVIREALIRHANYACEQARVSLDQLIARGTNFAQCVKARENALGELKMQLRA